MPIYTYQIIRADGSDGDVFEVVRKMSDPPLTRHPETGEEVKRIFKPVNIGGSNSEQAIKSSTSDKNLESKGFTKYVRNGKGHYERTAGSGGPSELHAD